jgi:formylglycine-generating enzyme required for sulfatase activity
MEKETLRDTANLADLRYSQFFRDVRIWEDWNDGYGVHAPVGSFRANAFGLHDVAGNVWEWCQDWYGGYDLEVVNETGLRADEVQEGPRNRVIRGGSFGDTASHARSADRGRDTPEHRVNNLGVRPARVRD